jgi:adenylylsulfate kinase-like enzyme
VAALFADAGCIAIVAQVSPLREDRARARAAAPDAFSEIYVRADIAVCEARDTKGLYRRARDGDIAEFTGVSSPYEEPLTPNLIIDTSHSDVAACAREILAFIRTAARS